MARNGISDRDVFKACDQIAKTKIEPTIERIRLILGSGSNSTISKHLNDWRDKDNGLSKKDKAYRQGYEDAIKHIKRIISKI